MAATHPWDNLTHDMREELHDLTHFAAVDAGRQARVALWATLAVLPILWGLDMLTRLVTHRAHWTPYVAGWANDITPGNASAAVMWAGAITLIAGLIVAAVPHLGGDILGVWLVILAIDLFSIRQMAPLGLGMLALALCSFAMARMMHRDHRLRV